MRARASVLVALFALGMGAAFAQSLGESAKKEKERREKLAGRKVRSFNDQDVGRSAPLPPTEEAPAAEGATTTPAAAPEKKAEEDPAKTPGYWRDRLSAIQKRISDLEAQLNRPGFDQDPANLRRRQRTEEDLQKARADLTALQEEARRKGVPVGWLR